MNFAGRKCRSSKMKGTRHVTFDQGFDSLLVLLLLCQFSRHYFHQKHSSAMSWHPLALWGTQPEDKNKIKSTIMADIFGTMEFIEITSQFNFSNFVEMS
jgi:hypothetical protein